MSFLSQCNYCSCADRLCVCVCISLSEKGLAIKVNITLNYYYYFSTTTNEKKYGIFPIWQHFLGTKFIKMNETQLINAALIKNWRGGKMECANDENPLEFVLILHQWRINEKCNCSQCNVQSLYA